MKKELDEELCRKYPLLYADRGASMQVTCMCWGFDTGPGWFKIIDELSAKLEPLIAALPDDCECGWGEGPTHPRHEGECKLCSEDIAKRPFYEFHGKQYPREVCSRFQSVRPRASQVKEKFGGLRFYMTTSTDEMDNLISEAEALSYKTCEDCGQPGKPNDDGWISTLCEKCRKERK